MRRFILFCEQDGVAWEVAGRHEMVAYLAELLSTTRVSGETANQYVSSINATYELQGLQAPA